MLQFICQTVSCLQMYLGSGYIMNQTLNATIYHNFEKTYYCSRFSYVYNCRVIADKRFKDATNLHFYLYNL